MWNPAAERLFGWSAGEIIGQPVPIGAGLREAPPDGVEFDQVRKDGSVVHVILWTVPLPGDDGAPAGALGFFAETSGRKRAEAALAERTRQLEAVRAVTTEITQELDLTHLLELIIQRAVDLVGAGQGLIRLWDGAEQTLVPKAWTGAREGRAVVPLRLGEGVAGTVAQRREGMIVNDFPSSPYALPSITQVSSHTAVLAEPLLYHERLVGVITIDREAKAGRFTDEDRKLIALFATHAAIAIENARLHEAAVRRGKELEALLRATRSVMSGLDLDAILDRILAEASMMAGTRDVRVILVDKKADVLRVVRVQGELVPPGFKYPLGSGLSGQVVRSGQPVFSPDVGADPRSYFGARYRALGMATYLGLPIKRGDEVLGVLVFSTTTPREYPPEELAYLTSFADQAALAIENARLYAALRQTSEELEVRVVERTRELREMSEELVRKERLASIGQLAGGVGHELRNPLGAIGNAAYYLRMRLREAEDAKVQKHLGILEAEVRRANKIVTDLLDFSRIKLPTRTATDLNGILRELVDRVPKDARVQHELDLDEDVRPVHVDADQIRQVFLNLILNAVEAMPDGGILRVRTRSAPDGISSAVSDTGDGIRPENLDRIFQPLFTTKTRGIGLGLAVSRSLAEANGGVLSVESRLGEGATFILTFPRERPKEEHG
jgi:signal transduction histidine kinase